MPESEPIPYAPLYRNLQGPPLVAGIPVPAAIVMVGLGALISTQGARALTVTGSCVALVWFVLAAFYGRDRLRFLVLALSLIHRFPSRLASYAPSRQRVREVP